MIAVIPARGGSKRIPRKNAKKMLGVPLFEYSVNIAKQSGLFKKIIVTTDDDKIAEMASKICDVHRRPKVSDTQVLKEVWDMFPKPLCCILPNPLTRVEDLVKAKRLKGDVWSAIQIKEDPPTFLDAGQFYFITGGQRTLYVVDEAVDINTPNDWDLALKILKRRKK